MSVLGLLNGYYACFVSNTNILFSFIVGVCLVRLWIPASAGMTTTDKEITTTERSVFCYFYT